MNSSETRFPFLLAICLSVLIYKNFPPANLQVVVENANTSIKASAMPSKALLGLNLESKTGQQVNFNKS